MTGGSSWRPRGEGCRDGLVMSAMGTARLSPAEPASSGHSPGGRPVRVPALRPRSALPMSQEPPLIITVTRRSSARSALGSGSRCGGWLCPREGREPVRSCWCLLTMSWGVPGAGSAGPPLCMSSDSPRGSAGAAFCGCSACGARRCPRAHGGLLHSRVLPRGERGRTSAPEDCGRNLRTAASGAQSTFQKTPYSTALSQTQVRQCPVRAPALGKGTERLQSPSGWSPPWGGTVTGTARRTWHVLVLCALPVLGLRGAPGPGAETDPVGVSCLCSVRAKGRAR